MRAWSARDESLICTWWEPDLHVMRAWSARDESLICTWWEPDLHVMRAWSARDLNMVMPGHLSVCVGDSSRRNEEIVKKSWIVAVNAIIINILFIIRICCKRWSLEWAALTGTQPCTVFGCKDFCGSTALAMLESVGMSGQIDWPAQQISHLVCSLAGKGAQRLEELIWTWTGQSITTLITWRKEEWRKEAADIPPSKVKNDLCSTRQTLALLRATVGRLLRDGMERVWAFQSARIPSWAEIELENWNLSTKDWYWRQNYRQSQMGVSCCHLVCQAAQKGMNECFPWYWS